MSAVNNKSAIYLALKSVPAGKVVTYGQLAKIAGLPGAARLVGTTLCQLPENTDLPWHRVINAQGKISMPENRTGQGALQEWNDERWAKNSMNLETSNLSTVVDLY